MAFAGKTIVIAGGASGIGLASTLLLAKEGAKVSVADVQQKALDEAAAQLKAVHSEFITALVDVRFDISKT